MPLSRAASTFSAGTLLANTGTDRGAARSGGTSTAIGRILRTGFGSLGSVNSGVTRSGFAAIDPGTAVGGPGLSTPVGATARKFGGCALLRELIQHQPANRRRIPISTVSGAAIQE